MGGRHGRGAADGIVEFWNRATGERSEIALLDVREQQVKSALVALSPEPPSTYGRSGYRPNLPQGRVYSRA